MLNKENLALLKEYTDHEMMVLIREAFKGLLQIYTIDNENNFFPVPIAKLQEIYTNHPSKVEVNFRFSTRYRGQIQDYGSWREIGISDLILDKIISDNIIQNNKAISKDTTIELTNEQLNPSNDLESPKERDQRLIQRAATIKQNNRKAKIKTVQEQILEEEKDNSKVTLPILRKIISNKTIKEAINKQKQPQS